MIKRILSWIVIAAALFAFYKMAGGDLTLALQTALDFLVLVITKLSDFFVSLFPARTPLISE